MQEQVIITFIAHENITAYHCEVFCLSYFQTGVVVRADTKPVVLDLSRPEIFDNLHVQRICLHTGEELERSVRTYF